MKIILTIITILVSLSFTSAQNPELQLKFKTTEKANVWLGKVWDYSYQEMKSPIIVEFNGKILKMYYDSGKIFMEQDVMSFEHKEKKNYDKLEGEIYILKVDVKGIIQYMIIEKQYIYEETITQIKIPFISSSGVVMSYFYYQGLSRQ